MKRKTIPKLNKNQILFEDNHLIVLAKPAGIATMGTSVDESNLLDLAKGYIKKKYDKPGNVYLGVVSRIDAFVSGVLVFARTSKAAARLNLQYKNSTVSKKYVAVIEGNIKQDSGEINSWLRKNERLHRVESFRNEVEGSKKATLKYKTTARDSLFCLLEIELITGRKHQIRSQFSDLGLPIFGDRKYDAKYRMENGIALHASELQFDHPISGDRMTFSCEIPIGWRQNRYLSKILQAI